MLLPRSNYEERRRLERMDSAELEQHQLHRLNELFGKILPGNAFYAEKLNGVHLPLESLDDLQQIPFTFKDELLDLAKPESLAVNLTFPLNRYVRFHQTSGTRGRPLVVLDTHEDWHWWIDIWQFVFDSADVRPGDRLLMAFSFGPFIGFWSANDAAAARGCLVIPSGGKKTTERLEMIRTAGANVICCTPSYALHMAEVAIANQINPASLSVRKFIVAGEPGGSIPATRERIEELWNAKVFDHSGATEVGPWGYTDQRRLGLHINESEFIAEFISVETGGHASEGELSELVLTGLGRIGCPVIRYRTGDLVRPTWKSDSENRFVFLDGGVLGRADDMLIIRGVNVFPSAIEQILRTFPEVVEYRMTAHRIAQLDQLEIEIEDRLHQPERVAEELQVRLGLRVDVKCVPMGSLPRYESKGLRFRDMRLMPADATESSS